MNVVYAGLNAAELVAEHVSIGDRVYRLWGLFVDRRFGIGRWAPAFLAVVPGLALLAAGDGRHRLVLGLVGIQVLIAAFAAITMMSRCGDSLPLVMFRTSRFWVAGHLIEVGGGDPATAPWPLGSVHRGCLLGHIGIGRNLLEWEVVSPGPGTDCPALSTRSEASRDLGIGGTRHPTGSPLPNYTIAPDHQGILTFPRDVDALSG